MVTWQHGAGFLPFTCGECGGTVALVTGIGRTFDGGYPLPNDYPMPTCEGCGEEYVSPNMEPDLATLRAGPVTVELDEEADGG